MKSSSPLIRIGLAIYLAMFFTYLLGPLVLMSVTAFNSASFPQVTPWEVLSFEWFRVLFQDDRILNGLWNSFVVGIFTVILSVVLGLAGALMLTQIWPKLRATYYTLIIAPILVPGVVIGISTLVFWDRVNHLLGLPDDSFLHHGFFLTVMGQSTFIASYCMLVFVARLQRYDTGLTEAALDLGATHVQAFRKIQLPFLAPAIGSAAVIAFLASFENYNTTTFTFQKNPTLTIELAQKVRYGINPSISALAFIIIAITVFFALLNEVRTRRAQLAIANGAPVGAVSGGFKAPKILAREPITVAFALFILLVVGVGVWAQFYDPEPAKAALLAEKRAEQAKAIEALKEKRRRERLQKVFKGPDIFGAGKSKVPQPPSKTNRFGDVFKPGNLKTSGGKTDEDAKKPAGGFGSVFNPGNLKKSGPGGSSDGSSGGSSGGSSSTGKKGGAFGGVFDPGNLKKSGPGGGAEGTSGGSSDGASGSSSEKKGGAFGSVFDPKNLKKSGPGESSD